MFAHTVSEAVAAWKRRLSHGVDVVVMNERRHVVKCSAAKL